MDYSYQSYNYDYQQRQQDELTAWGTHATFDSRDLSYNNVNTQALQRSGSSNSYDSYPDSGYDSHSMQWSNSSNSSSAVNHNNYSSPVCDNHRDPYSANSSLTTNYDTFSSPVGGNCMDSYSQYSRSYNHQPINSNANSSQQQTHYSQTSTAPSVGSQHTQVPATTCSAGTKKKTSQDTYICLYGGCGSEFGRPGDLDRHQKTVHRPNKLYCDYSWCSRSRPEPADVGTRKDDPFTRKDHLKEHYRDVHIEALAKRSVKNDPTWLDGKHLKPLWWRCSCLHRNKRNSGYICEKCREPADPGMVKARVKQFGH